jgi:hypothetical protein
LIAAVAPVGPVDGLGARPLHLAAENGWRETVELLLAAGAQPDERDRWERTALHRAAAFGYVECVRALVAGGAQIDARSASGGTALSLAAANGDEALYRALVAAGADPSRPDGFGRRPAELFESAQRARQPPRELPAEERARLEADAADAPMFHVWKTAGNPGPSGFGERGLELAIWPDGVTLFAADPDAPGRSMRVGRVSPTALAILQRELDETCLPAIGEAGVSGPDSSAVGVHDLRAAEPARVSVDPYFLRYLQDPGGSTSKRRALRTWLRALAALRSALPSASCEFEAVAPAGIFRGWRAGIYHQDWIPRRER